MPVYPPVNPYQMTPLPTAFHKLPTNYQVMQAISLLPDHVEETTFMASNLMVLPLTKKQQMNSKLGSDGWGIRGTYPEVDFVSMMGKLRDYATHLANPILCTISMPRMQIFPLQQCGTVYIESLLYHVCTMVSVHKSSSSCFQHFPI